MQAHTITRNADQIPASMRPLIHTHTTHTQTVATYIHKHNAARRKEGTHTKIHSAATEYNQPTFISRPRRTAINWKNQSDNSCPRM